MEILKAGLWDNARICSDIGEKLGTQDFTPDWNLIMEWSKKQTVMGLVSAGVSLLPEKLSPPPDVRKNMVYLVFRNIQMNNILNRVAVYLTETLKKENIDSVLLKGQGLARVYKNPKLRQCGDIDLYVGRKNYRKACEVVDRISKIKDNQGDCVDDDNRYSKNSETEKHYHCNIKGIPVEIHKKASVLRNSIYNKRFSEFEEGSLGRNTVIKIELDEGTVYVPPIDFDAIFIFLHAWEHIFSSGLGLRQVCDWTMYIYSFGKKLDTEILEKRLIEMGLKKGWQIFGYIAVNHLGLLKEECPLYTDKYRKEAGVLLELIWEDGNFGHYSEDAARPRPHIYLLRKFDTLCRLLKRNWMTFFIDKEKSLSTISFYFKFGINKMAKDISSLFTRKKR